MAASNPHQLLQQQSGSTSHQRSSTATGQRQEQYAPSAMPPPRPVPTADSTIIQLNVGGQHYESTMHTLTRETDSVLAELFRDTRARKDAQGRYFIDSDGKLFRYILLFLQHEALPPIHYAEAVHKVAEDLGMEGLRQRLEERYPFLANRMIQDLLISNNMPEATKHIQQIVQAALTMSRFPLNRIYPTISPIHLQVSVRCAISSGALAMDRNHRCKMRLHPIAHGPVPQPVDVMLGPSGICYRPKVYLNYLCKIMTNKGYTIFKFDPEPNSADCIDCDGKLFHLALTWL